MIEVAATLLRWSQLASNMILVGGCVFLAIAGSIHSPWIGRVERALPWLALILLAGLLGARKADVEILRGDTGRRKTVRVLGVSADRAAAIAATSRYET